MLIVLVNLGHFGIEFGVAPALGSVSLFADSIDFREDAAVNGLILVALGWSTYRRSIVGVILARRLIGGGIVAGMSSHPSIRQSSASEPGCPSSRRLTR